MKKTKYIIFILLAVFLFPIIVLGIPGKASAKVNVVVNGNGEITKVMGKGKLNIGKDIKGFNPDSGGLWHANITGVSVSEKNKFLTSKKGVLYNKKMTELFYYPSYKKDKLFKVPVTVKYIGSYAFINNSYIKEVVLNDGLEVIKTKAFMRSNVISINIPSTVRTIGGGCFSGCTELENVYNSAELTQIQGITFKDCISLKELDLGSSIVKIYENAFQNCSAMFHINNDNKYYTTKDGVLYSKDMKKIIKYPGLKKGDYTLPKTIDSINKYAFQNCKYLTSLTFNENITEFKFDCLNGCISLEELNLPGTLKTVGTIKSDESIYNHYNYNFVFNLLKLKKISIPENSKYFKIYDGALYSSDYKILWLMPFAKTNLDIHKDTELIVNKWCRNKFKEITVMDNKYFTSYKGVLYDKNIEKIMLFPGELTEYKLPASLKDAKDIVSVLNPFEYGCGKSLEEGCYNAAPNLKKITVEKGNQFFKSRNGVLFSYDYTKLYAYPRARKGGYVVPGTVKIIEPGVFTMAKGLSSLTFKPGLESCYVNVAGCSALKKVTFEEGIRTIFIFGATDYTCYKPDVNIKNIYFPSTLLDLGMGGISKTTVFHAYNKTGRHGTIYFEDTTYPEENFNVYNLTSIKDFIINNGYVYKPSGKAPDKNK